MIQGTETFLAAGRCYRNVLANVPGPAWDQPGLGEWNVRTLAGHTSRALTTVLTNLERPAERVDVESAAAYFAGLDLAGSVEITRRAIAAAEDLGADPVDAVDRLLLELNRVLPVVPDRVVTTIAGGMRFSDYLPTRIFELAVHTLDLATACAISVALPRDVELAAANLAVQIAVVRGDGAQVLMALSGRAQLPPGFSVV